MRSTTSAFVVPPQLVDQVGRRGHAVLPHRILQPPGCARHQLVARQRGRFQEAEDRLVERRGVGVEQLDQHRVLGEVADDRVRPAQHAGIGDAQLEPLLEGRGPRGQRAAHADPHQRDAFRVHFRQAHRVIHDRRHDLLPIGPEGQPLQADRRALARPRKLQAVIAALHARIGQVFRLLRPGVAALVDDQHRRFPLRERRAVEVAGQRRAFVGDFHPAGRDAQQARSPGRSTRCPGGSPPRRRDRSAPGGGSARPDSRWPRAGTPRPR